MTTRQYIGARYIPVFADPVEWTDERTYEPLMMVQHLGETYMTKQAVPLGVQLPDTSQGEESNEFWVHMSNWNAQIETYRQEVLAYNGRISTVENDLPIAGFDAENTVKDAIDAIGAVLPATDFDSVNTVKALIDAIGAVLPATDFDSVNTVKALIDAETAIRAIDFATVADMKASDELENGMIVHTLGFHSTGDNGSGYYKISTTGTANEKDVIACGDLFATLIVNDPFIIPEMLGAKANGTDDDSAVINYALTTYGNVKLSNKTYKCDDTIEVNTNQRLIGSSAQTTILEFADDIGNAIEIANRDVEIANLTVNNVESSTNNGIKLPDSAYAHRINLRNVIVNYCVKGLYNTSGSVWDCVFEQVRANYCSQAFAFEAGFNQTFISCYTHRCPTAILPGKCSATYIGCNFSIIAPTLIDYGTNNRLVFIDCNFECDVPVNTSGAVIKVNGWHKYVSCRFFANFTNSGTWMWEGIGSTRSCIFENCLYQGYGGAYDNNAFNPASPIGGNSTAADYKPGKIKFIGCPASVFPRPTNYYGNAYANFIDYDGNGMILTSTSSSTTLDQIAAAMSEGQMIYDDYNNKLGYSNGTNIVYLT